MPKTAMLTSVAVIVLCTALTAGAAEAQTVPPGCAAPGSLAALQDDPYCQDGARDDAAVERRTVRRSRTVLRPEMVERRRTVLRPEIEQTAATVQEDVNVPVARTELQPVTVPTQRTVETPVTVQ